MTAFLYRIQRLTDEAVNELLSIGIPCATAPIVKENKRAKKRLGVCKQSGTKFNPVFTIEISTVLCNESDDLIKEVIYHELLHTCKGCLNHGKRWKLLAAKANHHFGTHISTYVNDNMMNLTVATPVQYRYIIRCKNCGATSYRQKKSAVIKHPEKYRCKICRGVLEIKGGTP